MKLTRRDFARLSAMAAFSQALPLRAQTARVRGAQAPMVHRGAGAHLDGSVHAGTEAVEDGEDHRARERASGKGGTAGGLVRRALLRDLQLREFRRDPAQQGDRRGVHRAAELDARRIHDPRGEGRQARFVREADGDEPGGLPRHDRSVPQRRT